MKATVRKFLLASLAVASLTAFGGPTQAATPNGAPQASPPWCSLVPVFCNNHCNGHGSDTKCAPV